MKTIQELLDLLNLETLEENLFRGLSVTVGSKTVFGGQVMAQALVAAMRTVPVERVLHSLHGYFVLPGDLERPIIFQVETIRDGGSFTTRRVRAIQKGQVIFLMSASFQLQQEGFDHQIAMPDVAKPSELASWEELAAQFGDMIPEGLKRFLHIQRPLEFRPVELINPAFPVKNEPFRHIWMRSKGAMPEDHRLHQVVLAYASDYNLLTTALQPHAEEAPFGSVQMASLDHAMWFHREFRMDQWLLFAIDSPSASNARGFTRGSLFTEDGRLVASVVQEGLMRVKRT
ncbi:MAG: acyl-CoA thioesterase II [Saprospiraceae bacterium]|jgi:acyl-CoA thioesterase-2